jgi:predicted small secreted protein
MKKFFALTGLMALFGAALTGCSNTAEGAKEDANKAGAVVSDGANKAANAMDNAGKEVGATVKEAGKDAAGALSVTPMVKNAITADTELNDTKNLIDVDTKDGIVYLKGHVATTELKKKAFTIAEKTLKDAGKTDKVQNELVVKAH